MQNFNTSTDIVLQEKKQKTKPIWLNAKVCQPAKQASFLLENKDYRGPHFLRLSTRKPIREVQFQAYLGCVLSRFSEPPGPFQLSVTDLHVDWTLLSQSVLLPLVYEGTVLVSLCNPRGLQQMLQEALNQRQEHFQL